MEFLQRARLVSAWHMHACMHTWLFLMPVLVLTKKNTPLNISTSFQTPPTHTHTPCHLWKFLSLTVTTDLTHQSKYLELYSINLTLFSSFFRVLIILCWHSMKSVTVRIRALTNKQDGRYIRPFSLKRTEIKETLTVASVFYLQQVCWSLCGCEQQLQLQTRQKRNHALCWWAAVMEHIPPS